MNATGETTAHFAKEPEVTPIDHVSAMELVSNSTITRTEHNRELTLVHGLDDLGDFVLVTGHVSGNGFLIRQ